MRYPKIQSIWKRDPENKMVIIPGSYSLEEISSVKKWVVQEKVDGTNIRIRLSPDKEPEFYGRNDDSDIPSFVRERLRELFPEYMRSEPTWLFAEAYGPKIQANGALYADHIELCVFDKVINGIWTDPDELSSWTCEFMAANIAPIIGEYTLDEVVELIQTKPTSIIATYDCPMEGFVLKTNPVLFRDNGEPLYCKIKVKDYEKLSARQYY